MEKFIFYLYVTAGSKSSEQAILDVKNFCEGEIGFNYEIFIIDILQEPYLAEESQILATPTLIKVNLDKEIEVITTQGFTSYFLINWDIVREGLMKRSKYKSRSMGSTSVIRSR